MDSADSIMTYAIGLSCREEIIMIVRKGSKTCDRCGKDFEWIARKLERNEAFIGDLADKRCQNICEFDVINGRLVATGKCPHCGKIQSKHLVNEAI